MFIRCFDPGWQTGIAEYLDGNLISLKTICPLEIKDNICNQMELPDLIILEDSRLQNFIFKSAFGSKNYSNSVARDVGHIDAYSKMIVECCERMSIPCKSISPKNKGSKINNEQLQKLTGWKFKSNQHERDAAMVGYMYRNLKYI